MSYKTSIEWTDSTWNPILGCSKVSPGCKHCYAETLAERFRGVAGHPFELGFSLRLVPEKLGEPIKWKKPRNIFTCSMSDLFHEKVPFEFILSIFEVFTKAEHHTFQILTKRSERLLELSPRLPWSSNVWVGVSVESQEYTYRIEHLKQIPVSVRFISAEPLLAPIPHMPLSGIDWVIVGGESGSKAREMDVLWAKQIRDQCLAAKIPFFLKQLGGKRNKHGGAEALLDGRQWKELPFPKKSRLSLMK